MKKFIRGLCLPVLLCLLLGGTALAAQDITDWIEEYLKTEVSNIGLYEPDSDFAPCGELLYNETTGRTELTMGASQIYAMTAVSLTEAPAPGADGETAEVPEGYVLVSVLSEGREALVACMAADYAQDPEVRRAEEAAALAALEAENAPEEPEATPVPTPEPTPLPEPEPEADRAGLFDFLYELDQRDLTYLIIILAVLFVAILELGLLLVYRRRAESVARSYLRVKSQLDKTKRELGRARNDNMQKDRELIRLRDLLSSGAGQTGPKEKTTEPAKNEPGADLGYRMPDYGDWKF